MIVVKCFISTTIIWVEVYKSNFANDHIDCFFTTAVT